MDAAIATEALKLRRSPVALTGWLTVVLGVPALTAALLLIVFATEIVTALGAGGWIPCAAPAPWVGMGGPEAAATIGPTQLLLASRSAPPESGPPPPGGTRTSERSLEFWSARVSPVDATAINIAVCR